MTKIQQRVQKQNKKQDDLMTFGGSTSSMKTTTTRRSHSRGNLWSHHNTNNRETFKG